MSNAGFSTIVAMANIDTPAARITTNSLEAASLPSPIRAPISAANGTNSCTRLGRV